MKLEYVGVRQTGSMNTVLSAINGILKNQGLDAAAIISIDVERRPDETWLHVFYRQSEPTREETVTARDLEAGMTILGEHGILYKIRDVSQGATRMVVQFDDGTPAANYDPDYRVKVLR